MTIKPDNFLVLCGNIGTVYEGGSYKDAREVYRAYVYKSKDRNGGGKAFGESVTLFKNNEIDIEFIGELDQEV